MLNSWYERHIARFALFCLFLMVIGVGITSLEFGESKNGTDFIYTVRIQYFGADAEEMERSVTIPLENLLGTIPGIEEIRSQSELNTSRIDLLLQDVKYQREVFFALRDSVENLYAKLPDSVQRPQIFSSMGSDSPLMIISYPMGNRSINLLRNVVDRELKPHIENLRESGEVEVGGGSPVELHVIADAAKAHRTGISIQALSSILQSEYGKLPAGRVDTSAGLTIPLSFDARLSHIEDLRSLLIPNQNGSLIPLNQITEIKYAPKEPESINRVNGNQHVVLYVKSSGIGSPVTLSAEVRKILTDFAFAEPEILYDYGELLTKEIRRLLISLSISILALSGFMLLFFGNLRMAAALAFHLIFSLALSLAIFSILHYQISLGILSGLGIAVGLIADGAIILSLAAMRNRHSVGRLLGPIIASTLTTLVAMVPLFFVPDAGSGILELLTAFSLLLSISVVLAFLFLPPMIPAKTSPRNLPKWLLFPSVHMNPRIQVTIFAALFLAVPIFFVFMPWYANTERTEDILFSQIEFPSGTHLDYIDEKITKMSNYIATKEGVTRVESFARRNNGRLSVSYDSKKISMNELYSLVNGLNDSLFDSFLFISETAENNLHITIDLIGPDYRYLRSELLALSGQLEKQDWVDTAILHFKEGDPVYRFAVDSAKLAQSGFQAFQIADALRRSVFGPVSLKWFQDDREMDLRIMGPEQASLDKLRDILISADGGAIPVSSLGEFQKEEGTGRITRLNRQRANSLSIQVQLRNIAELEKTILRFLNSYPLKEGYAFRLDPKIDSIKTQYRDLVLSLIIAIIGIYVLLSAQYESLTAPLAVFLSIPVAVLPSLVFLALSGWGMTINALMGIIVVSGLVVNNCILLLDEAQARESSGIHLAQNIRHSLRTRMEDLIHTTGSTMLGLLPLMLVPGLNNSLKTLSVIVFFGILGSFFLTAYILPGVLNKFPFLIKKVPDLNRYENQALEAISAYR